MTPIIVIAALYATRLSLGPAAQLLAKHANVPDIVRALCLVACEPVEGEEPGTDYDADEDDAADEDDPVHVARAALASLAESLPPKLVAPTVLAFLESACTAHQPERTRRAGLAAVAAVAEV